MVLRIAHIADIHVRSLSRHAEYKEVFEAFVARCRELQVDHVFVGGDTFHTKTAGMSPECIDLMCWLFKAMASVAEVHVVLGNHDFNLVNPGRQDAITPIIHALRDPRIHLYKHSGTYEFSPGYCWGVFSLYDQANWTSVQPIPGKVNIACYHGPVAGATTETDWSVDDGVSVDMFKEWDMCLLGDIHRMQFLDYREQVLEVDESEVHLYPGAEVIG